MITRPVVRVATAPRVALHSFAGLAIPQAAEARSTSPRSDDRLWCFARAWPYRDPHPDWIFGPVPAKMARTAARLRPEGCAIGAGECPCPPPLSAEAHFMSEREIFLGALQHA